MEPPVYHTQRQPLSFFLESHVPPGPGSLLSSAKALLQKVDGEVFVSPHGEVNSPQTLQAWAYSRLLLASASHDSLAWSVLRVLDSW